MVSAPCRLQTLFALAVSLALLKCAEASAIPLEGKSEKDYVKEELGGKKGEMFDLMTDECYKGPIESMMGAGTRLRTLRHYTGRYLTIWPKGAVNGTEDGNDNYVKLEVSDCGEVGHPSCVTIKGSESGCYLSMNKKGHIKGHCGSLERCKHKCRFYRRQAEDNFYHVYEKKIICWTKGKKEKMKIRCADMKKNVKKKKQNTELIVYRLLMTEKGKVKSTENKEKDTTEKPTKKPQKLQKKTYFYDRLP